MIDLGGITNVNLRDGNDQAYTLNNANNRYDKTTSGPCTVTQTYTGACPGKLSAGDNAGNTTTDQNDYVYT